MKANISTTWAVLILSLLSIKLGYAAEIHQASPSSPAQIVINNAKIQSASGTTNVWIRLIAQDDNTLFVGQIYQAQTGATGTSGQDASYSKFDEIIFIPSVLENGRPTHQITLKLVGRNPSLFRVIDARSAVNQFFNPNGIHNLMYSYE